MNRHTDGQTDTHTQVFVSTRASSCIANKREKSVKSRPDASGEAVTSGEEGRCWGQVCHLTSPNAARSRSLLWHHVLLFTITKLCLSKWALKSMDRIKM